MVKETSILFHSQGEKNSWSIGVTCWADTMKFAKLPFARQVHLENYSSRDFAQKFKRKKGTCTCVKNNFGCKFTRKIPQTFSGNGILYKKLQEKTHMDMSQEPLYKKFIGKMPDPRRPPRPNIES